MRGRTWPRRARRPSRRAQRRPLAILGDERYGWDDQSALQSTTAPAGTAPSYSDSGSASCHGNGEQDN